MKPSNFQFRIPVLTKLEFYTNEDFKSVSHGEVDINSKFSININKSDSEPEAEVSITISIGKEQELSPFYIEATETSKFKWIPSEKLSESDIDKLLKQNAPALLIGYLRPIIANITGASQYPSYNLPFIDFTD